LTIGIAISRYFSDHIASLNNVEYIIKSQCFIFVYLSTTGIVNIEYSSSQIASLNNFEYFINPKGSSFEYFSAV
jgi:hypothetical protein